MSKLKAEQVKREDLGELADVLEKPFESVSRFMRSTAGIINGGLLFGDNVNCILKEITVSGDMLPVTVSLGAAFRSRPSIVIPVSVQGNVGVGCPAWAPTETEGQGGPEHAIQVRDIPGLTGPTRVTLTLLIAVG